MRKASIIVPFVFCAALAACGPDNGLGFTALGSVSATVTDATGTPTTTGFDFMQSSRVDPTLPQGSTVGFTGTCQIGPNGRTLQVQQVGGADARGLTAIAVTMPGWDQDTCTNCQHGTMTATVGGVAFVGSEQRGNNLPSPCSFTTVRRGSYGMQMTVTCMGLTATGDPRHVDVATNLTLDGCDGPSTNGM